MGKGRDSKSRLKTRLGAKDPRAPSTVPNRHSLLNRDTLDAMAVSFPSDAETSPDGHSDGHSRLESVLLMLKPSSRIEVLLSHVCVNVNSSVRLRRESSMYFVSGECHSFFRRSRLCSLVHYKAGAGWRRMQSIHTRRTYRGRCGQTSQRLLGARLTSFSSTLALGRGENA